MISNLPPYWLTAARALFAKPADWQSWADQKILSMPNPPHWIINMSMAGSVSELSAALADELDKMKDVSPASLDEVLIGYMWLRFKRGEIALVECLRLVGEAADAGASSLECESVFELLNRLEANHSNQEEIQARAAALLSDFGRKASEQWTAIQSVHGS